MLGRVFAIAMNAYREAVRARVLYGLFAAALLVIGYALIVASLSLHNETRVAADLGAASISIFAVLVAIVVGATSLHREVELKTIFPILARPVRRHEYLVGKYLGLVLTLAVFVALDAGAVLLVLALETHQAPWKVLAVLVVLGAILAVALVRAKHTRVFVVVPWAFAFVLAAFVVADSAGPERQLVAASAVLTLLEVLIIAALATFFSSFTSPAFTVVFTVFFFFIGRSADTLGNLPAKVVGDEARAVGQVLAKVFPNLHVYVPARPLLLGELVEHPVWGYVGIAAGHAAFYSALLLAVGALIFRKRDFQ